MLSHIQNGPDEVVWRHLTHYSGSIHQPVLVGLHKGCQTRSKFSSYHWKGGDVQNFELIDYTSEEAVGAAPRWDSVTQIQVVGLADLKQGVGLLHRQAGSLRGLPHGGEIEINF